MGKAGKTTTATFTVIYEGEHDDYGDLVVCVRGRYDLNDPGFVPLTYDFEVMRWSKPDGPWVLLEDLVVGQELVCLATTYWYMIRGTIVTSEAQPQREGTGEEAIWRLAIPEYGVTVIESCGLVPYDDDVYHIFVAHPGPNVYLTVILEFLNARPPLWIRACLDQDRVDAIIQIFLRDIGAIEAEDPSEGEEVVDAVDDDLSVC